MILNRVKISNFRCLEDVVMEFNSTSKKPLVVIRAQNESGKTTMLRAMQWCLFGDDALPKRGQNFRLHHMASDEKNISIYVEMEFDHTSLSKRNRRETISYTLRRSVIEQNIDKDNYKRESQDLELWKVTERGNKAVANPKDRLKMILGSNLKDLFFTDGDNALRFIEGKGKSEKRKLVQKAIKDMLSFDVLETSASHVANCTLSFKREGKNFNISDQGKNLLKANDILRSKIGSRDEELRNLEDELYELNQEISKVDKKINEALELGDKEKLARIREEQKKQEKQFDGEMKTIQRDLSKIFYSKLIGTVFLKDKISSTHDYLSKLKKKGVIPKASLPYLNELLQSKSCICGRELEKGTESHKTISSMIEEQNENSDNDDRVTQLRGIAKEYIHENPESQFKSKIDDLMENIENISDEIDDIQGKIKRVEKDIDEIPDTNIKDLRKNEKLLNESKSTIIKNISRLDNEIRGLKRDLEYGERLYDAELKKESRAKGVLNNIKVANDILTVIQETRSEIELLEIPKVSEKLNEYFLAMIKASDEEEGLIQKAVVNSEYAIEVYGPNEKELDANNDLNGASRRALTLSFILSLANVSGFVAPNVIDTPLGMMDDMIKNSVLDVLTSHSNQVILFLTRSEIRDVEDKIDKFSSNIYTIINSGHYPNKLKNNNIGKYPVSLVCNCSHRQYCNQCEHINDKSDKMLEVN